MASFYESQEFRERKADEKESSFSPKTARHLSELEISNCPNDIRHVEYTRKKMAEWNTHTQRSMGKLTSAHVWK